MDRGGGQVVRQRAVAEPVAQVGGHPPPADRQRGEAAAGLGEHVAADQPGLVAVRVVLLLAGEQEDRRRADLQQDVQHQTAQPHRGAAEPEDPADPQVGLFGEVNQQFVLPVAAVDGVNEPVVRRPGEPQQAAAAALGEVAELVGQHAGEGIRRQPGGQRHADRQHQFPPPTSPNSPPRVEADMFTCVSACTRSGRGAWTASHTPWIRVNRVG